MGLFVSNNPFHLLINQYLKCIIVNIGVIILIHRFIVPIFFDFKVDFSHETNRFTN